MASEQHDKSKLANQTKHKDAQVICSILKEIGICDRVCDYEPRVVSQLLEFTYCKCILKFS
jgi:hypothetical protein